MTERVQIREALASSGIVGDDLEWMAASCPSLAHAIDERNRRMDDALTIRCPQCHALRGAPCITTDKEHGIHTQRLTAVGVP